MTDKEDIKKILQDIDKKIDVALWQAVKDEDLDKELKAYEECKEALLSFKNLNDALQKERDRILAFCIMRIDNTLVGLGKTEKAVERSKESLDYAEKSGSDQQIARSALAHSTRLLNDGKLTASEA